MVLRLVTVTEKYNIKVEEVLIKQIHSQNMSWRLVAQSKTGNLFTV